MEALVAIFFGHREPIAQALGIRLENIGYQGIYLPTIGLLFFRCGVQNDTNGKQIVNSIHIAVLRLHFMVDRVDGFRASFNGKDEAFGFQFLFNRRNKSGDIGVAFRLLGIERVRYIFVGAII